MAVRVDLGAVAAAALLGCTHYPSPHWNSSHESAASVEELGQTCDLGDVSTCLEAIEQYRELGYHNRAFELAERACDAGGLEACYLAAVEERELGRIEASQARLVETCARGNSQSCFTARHYEVQGVLDQHLALWRCVELLEPAYSGDVWIRFLVVDRDGDHRADILLEPAPEHPILQACVRRALHSTSFAFDTQMWGDYRLQFDPELVAAKLAELAPSGPAIVDEVEPDSCPELDQRCESVPLLELMRNAVWIPDDLHSVGSSAYPQGEGLLGLGVEFCVEPDGTTSRIRTSTPHLGHGPIAEVAKTVGKWRFLPIVIDDQRVLACSRIEFELWFGFPPPIPSPTLMSGVVVPPLSVEPARAIRAPAPSTSDLRSTRFARARERRGLPIRGRNITAFCVDERGRTVDVTTRRRFHDSREIDEIMRETVKRWRFEPMLLAGVPHSACMVQEFDVVLP
jgi:hypothetical protein